MIFMVLLEGFWLCPVLEFMTFMSLVGFAGRVDVSSNKGRQLWPRPKPKFSLLFEIHGRDVSSTRAGEWANHIFSVMLWMRLEFRQRQTSLAAPNAKGVSFFDIHGHNGPSRGRVCDFCFRALLGLRAHESHVSGWLCC